MDVWILLAIESSTPIRCFSALTFKMVSSYSERLFSMFAMVVLRFSSSRLELMFSEAKRLVVMMPDFLSATYLFAASSILVIGMMTLRFTYLVRTQVTNAVAIMIASEI